MTSHLPKLRADLTVSEQQTGGNTFFVVKDAVRGQFFRLREPEYFIARQLDGVTPFEVVRLRVEQKFDAHVSHEDLSSFVARLKSGGLLELEPGAARPTRATKRVQGNILFLRCKILDPDQLFDRLVDRIRFLFTPGFVIFSAMSILLASFILLANWQDAKASVSSLYRFSAVPLIILVVFLVIGAHEFAHGLTCKHFGGHVHEIGFLLMYFQPAFYCNVSDAWLFPQKSRRMWVGFAGPYFELFLWSLAIFTWRVTAPETWPSAVATIVIATSGIKTLLNFNPMIKWDGYYLLSDWVGIPNLRTKAFQYIGDKLRRLWAGTFAPAQKIPLRERRILFWYGLLAVGGSFALLAIALVTVGVDLVQKRQSIPLLLFLIMFWLRVRRRVLRIFGSSRGANDPEDDLDAADENPAPASQSRTQTSHSKTETPRSTMTQSSHVQPYLPPAKEGNGHRVAAAEPAPAFRKSEDNPEPARRERPATEKSARRSKSRFTRRLLGFLKLAVLGGGAAAILLFVHCDLRVPGDFNVLPVRNADVRAEVEGIIEEVTVREGQFVQAGDLVARLSEHELRAELEKNKAQIEETRARLKLLEAGARSEEVQLAQVAIARSEEQLKFRRDRAERDRKLYEEQLLSLNDYEESERTVAELQSDLAEAKRKLDLLLAGARSEEIDAMKAAVANLEAQRNFLGDQLRRGRVVSLASGVVTTPALQLKELDHQLIKKGDLIARIYDFETITALIAVSEKEIADVHIGQAVWLKARAYPDLLFNGKVTGIATTALAAGASANPNAAPSSSPVHSALNTILVTTEIDNHAGFLKPGMTGFAKISCGDRRLLDLVKRRLSRTVSAEFWSWW
jgi:putative peptide zinc metalloprotease protein